jgi:hypothetical protein
MRIFQNCNSDNWHSRLGCWLGRTCTARIRIHFPKGFDAGSYAAPYVDVPFLRLQELVEEYSRLLAIDLHIRGRAKAREGLRVVGRRSRVPLNLGRLVYRNVSLR